MISSGLISSFKDVWDNKPYLVVAVAIGFLIFLFVVIDAWRHRRHHPRRHLWK
jgi:hypothetical protein